MKSLPLAALLLALMAFPHFAAPAAPAKKTAASKSKKRRKTVPKAPPVSAKARAEALDAVENSLARAAQLSIENPAALVPFFEQLYRHGNGEAEGPVRVIHYGDSHTAADEWTGAIRALFQGQFGDGGSGYSLAGRPWRSYRHIGVRVGGTQGWYSDGLFGRTGDGRYGLGGVSVSTRRPRESVFLEAEAESVELFYLRQPGGGSLRFTDNGAPVDRISTAGELGPAYFRYKPSEPGTHRLELTTLDRAPVRLFGWVAEKEKGITYEPMGINGASASIVFRWEEETLASNLARRAPALVVLAYGTNEASNKDWNLENYREMFSALIGRFRAALPSAAILVLGPPDRQYRANGKWIPFDRMDAIVEAQRQAAHALGCAFWDTREKMGGKGSMKEWTVSGLAQWDHVHFTAPGYRRMGYIFFRDLMTQYETYTVLRSQLQIPAEPKQAENGHTDKDR
jgi:lysophospholipase L1-like esterase